MAGLDIGLSKGIGSYFSNIRQEANFGQKPNYESSEDMNGHEFIDKLI